VLALSRFLPYHFEFTARNAAVAAFTCRVDKAQTNMIEASISFVKGSLLSGPAQSIYAPWIALSRVKGLGGVNFKKLAAHFIDPTQVFSTSAEELAQVHGLDQAVIESLVHFSGWEEIERELRRVRDAGVSIVAFTEANYPARLRMIADPPPLLYVKGEIRADDEKAVAVVGSRSASDYGLRVGRDLSRGLAALGFTVVSGMARGVDGMAHETALNSGGRTIAVLGSGVDCVYPPEHATLYQRICENGAVISELPMGARPAAFNFPSRNRLISGLSLGVVVVEATEKSGSLITAALAVEQGREVFAVPGEVGSSRSRGAHRLIRQGAKLVETVQDIVEEIAPQLWPDAGDRVKEQRRMLPQHVKDDVKRVFGLLQERSLQIDEVIESSGFSPSRVSEILLDLELQGYLRQLPGKRYTAEL
jgi:DNA processing protein